MIQDYLEEVIDDNIKPTGKGNEVHFSCPICGEIRHRMYVNLNSHLVVCHNCGYSSNFIQFIMDLEGCNFVKAKERYTEIKGTSYIPEDICHFISQNLLSLQMSTIMLKKRPIPLPDEYTVLSKSARNPIAKMTLNYLTKERGLSIQQIQDNKIGYCTSGQYHHRAIIPIYNNDDLQFWVARAITSTASRKELSPPNEPYEISKSEVIFNIHKSSLIHNSLVLSEGIFDALSYGTIGASLLGKRLSSEQFSVLMKYKSYLDCVYISLDNDAYKNATQIADVLCKHIPVKLINLSGGDPNDLLRKYGRKYLFNLIDTAEEYDLSNKLQRKFFDISYKTLL